MQLTLESNSTSFKIKCYQPGTITIDNNSYSHSMILTNKFHNCTEKIIPWDVKNPTELSSTHLLKLTRYQPRLIILGTGNKLIFPPLEVTHVLNQHNIGLEIMGTAAACRTYTILAAERRNVLTALIIHTD